LTIKKLGRTKRSFFQIILPPEFVCFRSFFTQQIAFFVQNSESWWETDKVKLFFFNKQFECFRCFFHCPVAPKALKVMDYETIVQTRGDDGKWRIFLLFAKKIV
jgi:hypothetical protein